MWMVDHDAMEVVYTELVSDLEALSDSIGDGWTRALQMNSRDHSQEVFGYEADYYDFSYVSEMPLPGMAGVSIPGMGALKVTVENTGEVWVAPNAPGIDIVQSFYRNLTALIQPNQQMSFIAGTLMNLVAMLDYGMPIIIDQTTRSKVMGRTSVSGKSESHVANIRILPLETDWCNVTMEVPDGYTLTDVNEEIENALSDAGLSQEEMQGMEQMSQNQSGGTSPMDLLGGLFGGSGTSSGQPPAEPPGSAAATGSRVPQDSAGSPGSNMPPAEELQGDSVTESVQKHLQALGYDVGTADGEMSLATTIAISTFQAEKGMEVTGEVSPQLLGVLSAEVDSRR